MAGLYAYRFNLSITLDGRREGNGDRGNNWRAITSISPLPPLSLPIGWYTVLVAGSPFLMCIDYGLAKVGVAVGSSWPSTPLEVVRYGNRQELLDRLARIAEMEHPEGVLIGWPAEHLTVSTPQTENIRLFGEELGNRLGLSVVYYPETLTTQMAQRRMIDEGVSKQRRRDLEDGYAAAVILDDYLQQLD